MIKQTTILFQLLLMAFVFTACSQENPNKGVDKTSNKKNLKLNNMQTVNQKMKVDIWSDIACPFCYIGKRNFETAMKDFPNRDQIEVEWHSFQLVPDAKSGNGLNADEALAAHHHTSVEQARVMNDQVSRMAAGVGLKYNMDKLVWANTFDAHRMIQYAKTIGKADILEERLFQAHFINGEDVGDYATLIRIAVEMQMDKESVKGILAGNKFADEVKKDIEDFARLGGKGVPTFVLGGNKAAFSGAVSPANIKRTLNSVFNEWKKEHPSTDIQGAICLPGGDCN
ncbi:DsbA family protein [Pedobacter sp. MC2016-24]|uniref:DsbA family oxidoreductase n=1 Tax=Pedobacter sp. MC2016-24 TaxID=2780090 RepID=UPI001881AD34|nr:DsbA family oxidoreductase [Pedobacter sp. MC2016-24]MBE9601583.1 DsbA family oxidoreductase [Pedobacter sp. MC2016-24]